MAQCPACNAEIQHAQRQDNGEHVPLDLTIETTGPGRYRLAPNTAHPLIAIPVPADREGDAFPDHRKECPGAAR